MFSGRDDPVLALPWEELAEVLQHVAAGARRDVGESELLPGLGGPAFYGFALRGFCPADTSHEVSVHIASDAIVVGRSVVVSGGTELLRRLANYATAHAEDAHSDLRPGQLAWSLRAYSGPGTASRRTPATDSADGSKRSGFSCGAR